jgi:hypothetical protein
MGCSLADALEKVPYDEYRLWEIFWQKDLEVPRRPEYYAMGIMAECRRPHVKDPSSVKLEQMLIRFSDKKSEKAQFTQEQLLEMNKARWLMGVGMDPKLAKAKGGVYRGETNKSIMRRKVRPNQT